MSHTKVKIKYVELDAYGKEEWHTLYCHHNHSGDIVSFYDEKGECILSYEETEHTNILEAMQILASPFKKEWWGEREDGVEFLTPEEHEKIFK